MSLRDKLNERKMEKRREEIRNRLRNGGSLSRRSRRSIDLSDALFTTFTAGGAFLIILLLSVLFTAIGALLPAFGLMILLGIIHSFYAVVPAIGYGLSYVIALALGFIMSFIRSSVTVSK